MNYAGRALLSIRLAFQNRRCPLLIAPCTVALLLAVVTSASAHVSCERSKVATVRYPSCPANACSGKVTLTDGRFALLLGSDTRYDPDYFSPIKAGDHVETCLSDVVRSGKLQISVVDLDANFMYVTFMGPEGAS